MEIAKLVEVQPILSKPNTKSQVAYWDANTTKDSFSGIEIHTGICKWVFYSLSRR